MIVSADLKSYNEQVSESVITFLTAYVCGSFGYFSHYRKPLNPLGGFSVIHTYTLLFISGGVHFTY